MAERYALVVHGGAGTWKEEDLPAALAGVRAAAQAGFEVLRGGGSAVDAVVAAVVVLEDDPLFNAGTGSALNLAGDTEMDACIMDGRTLRAGAVGALPGVRNPVLVARKVMEETDHVLLVGEGAAAFAREMGFPPYDPVIEQRRRDYRNRLEELKKTGNRRLPALRLLLERHPPLAPGTVGAAALDTLEGVAAATSTGGLSLKLPGRVGDTPIPGAGTYASDAAAASATGHGETILRLLLTRDACGRVAHGNTAQEAAEAAIRALAPFGGEAGLVMVDGKGRVGVAHDTDFMPHAFCRAPRGEFTVRARLEPGPPLRGD